MEEDWDDWSDLGETEEPELDEEDRAVLVESIERHSLASILDSRIRSVHPTRANIILKFFLHAFGTDLLRELCRGPEENLDHLMQYTLECLEREVEGVEARVERDTGVPLSRKGKERADGCASVSTVADITSRHHESGDSSSIATILMDPGARARRARILSAVRGWARPNQEPAVRVDPESEVLMQVVAAENLGAGFGDLALESKDDEAVAAALQQEEYEGASVSGSRIHQYTHIHEHDTGILYQSTTTTLPVRVRPAANQYPEGSHGVPDPDIVGVGIVDWRGLDGQSQTVENDNQDNEGWVSLVDGDPGEAGPSQRSRPPRPDFNIPGKYLRRYVRRELAKEGLQTTNQIGSLFSRDAYVGVYNRPVICTRCTASPALNNIGQLCPTHFRCRLCCFACIGPFRDDDCQYCTRRHRPQVICTPLLTRYAREVTRPQLIAEQREREQRRAEHDAEVVSIRGVVTAATGAAPSARVSIQAPRIVPRESADDNISFAGLKLPPKGQEEEVVVAAAASAPPAMALGTMCYSWGKGLDGQTGHGVAKNENTTTPVELNLPSYTGHHRTSEFTFVTCGRNSSYVLDAKGTLHGMGADIPGVTGLTPAIVPFSERYRVVQVAQCLSGGLGAVLTAAGTVYVWASARANASHDQGAGLVYMNGMETSTVVAVEAGNTHLVMLTSGGEVFTFGVEPVQPVAPPRSNDNNNNNNNNTRATAVEHASSAGRDPYSKAFKVRGLLDVVAVAAGREHSVALTRDGRVWTWGKSVEGALGFGPGKHATADALPIPDLMHVTAIASGLDHVLAIDQAGSIYAWGGNRHGQLGLGNSKSQFSPRRLSSLSPAQHCACGPNHTAVISQSGDLFMCGENRCGQLGLGHTKTQYSLVAVPGLLKYDVESVALGSSHTIAIVRHRSPTARGLGAFVGSEHLADITIQCARDRSATPAHRFVLARALDPALLAREHHTIIAHGCSRSELDRFLTALYTEQVDGGNNKGVPSIMFTLESDDDNGTCSVEMDSLAALPSLLCTTRQVAANFATDALDNCHDAALYADVIFACHSRADDDPDQEKDDEFDDGILPKVTYEVHAHRIVLASRSEIFRLMFTSGMREAQTGGAVPRIDFPNVSIDAVIALLSFLYTGEVSLEPETVVDVLSLAHRYHIDALVNTCETYITPAVDSWNLFDMAMLSDTFHLGGLQRTCVQVASRHASRLHHHAGEHVASAPGWLRGAIIEVLHRAPDHSLGPCTRAQLHAKYIEQDNDVCYDDPKAESDDEQDEYLRREMVRIGALVAAARKAKKLTQSQLANQVNVSLTLVQQLEAGKHYPPARLRGKLERVLSRRL